ncbi:transport and Golgi organization protein 1 homolog [Marmota flaviventris]|uniref:transport and Golgi organization protein 1 homolog n=1 Tax=Marmota flaviventris TaxID=93162 RepID=UPI003A867056
MSRSQFGQGKKPLDIFFWVNEITGEITYPPQNPDTPAAAEKQERTVAQHGGTQAATRTLQTSSDLRQPSARLKLGQGAPPPFAAIPVTISPPGGALPAQGPLGPAPLPLPGTCNPCHHVTPRGDSASWPPWTNSSAPTGQIFSQPFSHLGLHRQAEKMSLLGITDLPFEP